MHLRPQGMQRCKIRSTMLISTSPYINVNDPYYARLHVLDSAGNITRMYQIPKKVLAEKSGFFRTLFSSSFRVRSFPEGLLGGIG